MERASNTPNSLIRIMAYLALASLVIALPLSAFSNNIERTVYSAQDISEPVVNYLLIRGGVRDSLADFLLADVWGQGHPGDTDVTRSLTHQDRLKITQILFPKEWVRNQVHNNLEIFFSWIESEADLPQLNIDLVPLQENLHKGDSIRISTIVVDSWPECAEMQERRLERAIQPDSEVPFEYCKPDGGLHQRVVEFVDRSLLEYVGNLPDDIPVFEEMLSEEIIHALEDFRQGALGLLVVLNVLKPLPFFFLGIIMTLIIRSWRDLGRWWGFPLLIGALITLLFLLFAYGVGPRLLKNYMVQAGQIAEVQETIVDTVWEMMAKILNRTAIQALFIGLIGLVMVLLSRRSGKEPPDEMQPSAVEEPSSIRPESIPPPPQVKPFDPDGLNSSNVADRAEGH